MAVNITRLIFSYGFWFYILHFGEIAFFSIDKIKLFNKKKSKQKKQNKTKTSKQAKKWANKLTNQK